MEGVLAHSRGLELDDVSSLQPKPFYDSMISDIFYILEFSQPFLIIPAPHRCPANCWLSEPENSILLSKAASGEGLREKSAQVQPLLGCLYFLVVKLLQKFLFQPVHICPRDI